MLVGGTRTFFEVLRQFSPDYNPMILKGESMKLQVVLTIFCLPRLSPLPRLGTLGGGQGPRAPTFERHWQELGGREKNELGYWFPHLSLGEYLRLPRLLPCHEVKGQAPLTIPPPLPLLLERKR